MEKNHVHEILRNVDLPIFNVSLVDIMQRFV